MKYWIPVTSLDYDKISSEYGTCSLALIYKKYQCELRFGTGRFSKKLGLMFTNESNYTMFIMRFC